MKALARLSPVLDMVGAAARGFPDMREVDVRALVEQTVAVVVDHMGISESYGAPKDLVVAEVARAAAAMRPGDDEAAVRIALWTVDWLRNAEGGGRARQVTFSDPAAGWDHATLDVTLLYEDQSPLDGEFVLRASPEAINVLLVAFDHDLADAQVANEAVMQVHIESGNVDRASGAARAAAEASVGYSQRLQAVLERTRRDVTAVDWSDTVPQMLDEAAKHLRGRTNAEQHLLASAEQMRDQQTDLQQARAAAELVELVRGCLARHVDLLNDLMPARRTFLDEQRRQQLEVVRAPATVAVGAELLVPLLAAPTKDAADPLDRFVEGALGAVPPRRHGLALLVDQLMAPRREHGAGPGLMRVDDEDLELVDDIARFSDDELAAAEELVDSASDTYLSDLLERARDGAVPDDLVVLLAGAAFAFEVAGRRPVNDGTVLEDSRFAGDDLRFDRDEHDDSGAGDGVEVVR